jgi:signal transduction histidine kinase
MRFCFSLSLVLFFSLAGAVVHAAEPGMPLTRVADIRGLSREEAAQAREVKIRAVVTWRSAWAQLTVQDDSAGIWIHVNEARKQGLFPPDRGRLDPIRVGDELEIEGVTFQAGYAPVILPRTIRIVGPRALPEPRALDRSRFFSGAEDCLRIEVTGVIQGYHATDAGWFVHMNADPGHFIAEFSRAALPDPAALVDAVVSVTGVAISRFNTRGELVLPRVICSEPAQVRVMVPGKAPFAAPLVPLGELMPFRPEPLGPHRLRVMGTVIFALPGKFFYLQDGTSAVRVETQSAERWQAGDRVEVAGFVTMPNAIAQLTEAQVRKLGTGPIPAALPISPQEIIALNQAATITGQLAKPHDFDGHLIRFPARLLAVQASPESASPFYRLTLRHGDMVLGATLHAAAAPALDALQPGSELEVTGISQLEYTAVWSPRQAIAPVRLDVILRDAADVVVVRAPSWWTARRLLGVVAVVLLALGGVGLWAWQLRRQVRRKTQELATAMRARRDAAIEFQATLRERTRLAANLHDTLLQTLGGIGFQIEACEAEAAAPRPPGNGMVHLPVARKMLDHAMDELRGSVWALRSLPLHGLALPEALRALTERAGAGHNVRFEVHTTGDLTRMTDFVAGNLLLAAQEAVHNAIRHGQATAIRLEVGPGEKSDWITLSIADNGRGFTPGQQAGASQGHFGLTGMQERMERLNGKVTFTSAPGQGTTIRLEVPLLAYDEALA